MSTPHPQLVMTRLNVNETRSEACSPRSCSRQTPAATRITGIPFRHSDPAIRAPRQLTGGQVGGVVVAPGSGGLACLGARVLFGPLRIARLKPSFIPSSVAYPHESRSGREPGPADGPGGELSLYLARRRLGGLRP